MDTDLICGCEESTKLRAALDTMIYDLDHGTWAVDRIVRQAENVLIAIDKARAQHEEESR